jgi:hypothetical protein
VLEAVDGELVEAGDGVGGSVERLEEAVDSGEFQSGGGASGEGGEFDVAIAHHGLFQAAQQDIYAGAIEMLEFRTVQYYVRPVGIQTGFQFAKKCPALGHAELCRQLLYRYGSRRHDFQVPNCFF